MMGFSGSKIYSQHINSGTVRHHSNCRLQLCRDQQSIFCHPAALIFFIINYGWAWFIISSVFWWFFSAILKMLIVSPPWELSSSLQMLVHVPWECLWAPLLLYYFFGIVIWLPQSKAAAMARSSWAFHPPLLFIDAPLWTYSSYQEKLQPLLTASRKWIL